MRPLDPATVPLHGQVLIEASAGTGKTYTIGLLFLRLLLEQGLALDQILVVTYTRAATAELRARLRARIRQALDRMQDHTPSQQSDDLGSLLNQIPDPHAARTRLRDALTLMDQAAIFTIHGFCQRMLQEFAFESGLGFTSEFIESEERLKAQIVDDFWRRELARASAELSAWAEQRWSGPLDLLGELTPLCRRNVHLRPKVDEEDLKRLTHEARTCFEGLRRQWRMQQEEVQALLTTSDRLSRAQKKGYSSQRLTQGFQALDELFARSAPPLWLDPILTLFTPEGIEASLLKKGKGPVPEHPFLTGFGRFFRLAQQLDKIRLIRFLTRARDNLFQELDRRKQRAQQIGFDDLLARLDLALRGQSGQQLSRRIGHRFPAILIDEFQDTDPLQYRIFSRIHAHGGNSSCLFMIGDPKQAIYGFRGADIFTYFQARTDTPTDNRLTMTRNYRSSPAMIEQVNQLFVRNNGFLLGNDLRCPRIAPGNPDLRGPLLVDHQEMAPITWLLLNGREESAALNLGQARERAALFCAAEINRLLTEPPLIDDNGRQRPLCGGDIGILVRSHHQAEQIRQALSKQGLACATSSRQSVFDRPEADHLVLLMETLLDLRDSGRIRTLLAQPLFGWTAPELDRLNQDEQQWEQVLDRLGEYGRIWHEHGFLAMFHHLLAREDTVARIGARPGGERSLTDWLHLAELIQETSARISGGPAVLRDVLARQRLAGDGPETEQLRLESDEELIQVVTIHKAKGLQYPVVALPFAWEADHLPDKAPYLFHDPDNRARLMLSLDTDNDQHRRLAREEQRAEQRRLLYVALTRARFGCLICWGRIRAIDQSSLYGLVHPRPPANRSELMDDLHRCSPLDQQAAIVEWPPPPADRPLRATRAHTPLRAARFTGAIDPSWQVTSYSRLTATTGAPQEPATWSDSPSARDRFGFPRGPGSGICLHGILEETDFTDPDSLRTVAGRWLERSGLDSDWLDPVSGWLHAVLATELWPGFSLSRLHTGERINEMGFTLPLCRTKTERVNRLLEEFSYPPLPGQERELNGLLVGTIDLVFRDQHRYWLADYKSNFLGPAAEDYGLKQMQQAMREHRYDLQALFYTLALHRFLGRHLDDYDYERDCGGACYLFLRGMDPDYPPGNGILINRVEPELINELDALVRGETR